MRTKTFLSILFSSALVSLVGCSDQLSSDEANNECENGDGDCDDGGGGGGGGDGDGGDGIDVDVYITADAQIDVAATAVVASLDGLCVDVDANVSASLDASLVFNHEDDTWRIDYAGDHYLDISSDSTCACEDISLEVTASASVHADLDVNIHTCDLFCDDFADDECDAECGDGDEECRQATYARANDSCSNACETILDGHISVSAQLDASVDLDIDGDDSLDFNGTLVDLEFDGLFDKNGNRVNL